MIAQQVLRCLLAMHTHSVALRRFISHAVTAWQVGWRPTCAIVGGIGIAVSLVVVLTVRELTETERVRYQLSAATNDTIPILGSQPGNRVDRRMRSTVSGIALVEAPCVPAGGPSSPELPALRRSHDSHQRHHQQHLSTESDDEHSIDERVTELQTMTIAVQPGSALAVIDAGDDPSTVLLPAHTVLCRRQHVCSPAC
jgi:hypothetical protein